MKLFAVLLTLSMPLTTVATGQQNNASVPAACGDNSVKFAMQQGQKSAILTPAQDNALVYVIAQGAYVDNPSRCGVITRVGLDGRWIGANCEHSYLTFTVEPGEHHLCSNWQTKVFYHPQPASLIGFNAKAGSVYFFRAAIYGGAQAPLLIDLQPLNPDEAQFLLSTSSSSNSSIKR